MVKLQMDKQATSSAPQPVQNILDIGELANALREMEKRKAAVATTTSETTPSTSKRPSKVQNSDRASVRPKKRAEAVPITNDHRISESAATKDNNAHVSRDLRTFISKTESKIPDVLSAVERTEASVGSVPRTIAEVIDSLTVDELSASQNISEDIAAEFSDAPPTAATGTIPTSAVSARYSNDFEDEDDSSSTVKEVASAASASHSRLNTMSAVTAVESGDKSDSTSAESRNLLVPSTSTLSLFPEEDSFNQFTLQMFKQHLEEESLRARHKYDLLKKKEQSLIERARLELEGLKKKREATDDKDQRERLRKKEASVLAELKTRRSEIDRLKKSIKVAEKERRMILKEQQRLLAEDDTGETVQSAQTSTREPSTVTEVRSRSTRSIERQVLQGLKKLQKTTNSAVAEKSKDLERLLRHDSSADSTVSSGTEAYSSVHEDLLRTESERTTTTTTTTATSPSKMQKVKQSLGATLKTPLSPKVQPAGRSQKRRRHSSADSDDSQQGAVSHSETVSDHSDVEIRINVLQDELQRRMMTAAKLKKQQKAKSKEQLRLKEETLKKQIEQYDKLIEETKADLDESSNAAAASQHGQPAASLVPVVQPQIKTPYRPTPVSPTPPPTSGGKPAASETSGPAASEASSSRTTPELEETGGESSSSIHTVSHESSAAADTIISKNEDLFKSGVAAANVTTAKLAEVQEENGNEEDVRTASAAEEEEEVPSDLNYSDDFTSSNGSGGEVPTPTKSPSTPQAIPSAAASTGEIAVEVSSTAQTKDKTEKAPKPLEKKSQDGGGISTAKVDRITTAILDSLLKETLNEASAYEKSARSEEKAAAEPLLQPRPTSSGSSTTATPTALSPRTRPQQELMLSTFDVSSESSDDGQAKFHVVLERILSTLFFLFRSEVVARKKQADCQCRSGGRRVGFRRLPRPEGQLHRR